MEENTIRSFEDLISNYDETDEDIKRIKYSQYIDTMYYMQIKPFLDDVTEYDLARIEKCYRKMMLIRLKLPIITIPNSERTDKVLQESLDNLLNQEPCLETFSLISDAFPLTAKKPQKTRFVDRIKKWFQIGLC